MGRGLDIIMPIPQATSLKIPQTLKDAKDGVSGQERGTQPEEGEGGGGTGNMLMTALVGMHKSHRTFQSPVSANGGWTCITGCGSPEPYPTGCACMPRMSQPATNCLLTCRGRRACPSCTDHHRVSGWRGAEKAQAEISQQLSIGEQLLPKLSLHQDKYPTVGCIIRMLSALLVYASSLFSRLNVPQVCFSQGSLLDGSYCYFLISTLLIFAFF